MNKFTLFDFIIFLISLILAGFVYFYNIYISGKIILAIITVPFTVTPFLLSISALIINSWEHNIVQKLIESKHYYDLLHILKLTSYCFIFTGSVAMLYGVFYDVFNNKSLVMISSVIVLFFVISIGYLVKNIRRIFMILKYLGRQ